MQEALSKLIASRLSRDSGISAYLQEERIPLEEAVHQVMTDQSKSLTLEQYKDIVDGKHDCNWSETGCVMYFTRPPPGRTGIRCHTHCGADINATRGSANAAPASKDVCSLCIVTLEGKKLADKLESGLTREMYYTQKQKLRLTTAMSKIRLLDERLLKLSTGRKTIWGFAYDHDDRYGYHGPTGLVFHPRVVRGIKDNYTVGIDADNDGVIRKITVDDLRKIGDFNVIRVIDSMEDRAARYVTRNMHSK